MPKACSVCGHRAAGCPTGRVLVPATPDRRKEIDGGGVTNGNNIVYICGNTRGRNRKFWCCKCHAFTMVG